MKTPEQLKGAIRNISRQNNISAQEVLQRYMFERLLERLSVSPYRKKFILKGGLLISSMIGVSERTTMDMDASVCGITVDKDMLERTFKEILSIDVGDGIVFRYDCMEPIREDDEYDNFRVHIVAEYGKICNRMKIDVTTGDRIIPSAINYSFSSFFDEVKIDILAYAIETILAEKYETILRRNIGNTRSRDFYDLYVLFKRYASEINPISFKLAVENTARKRGSLDILADYKSICAEIIMDDNLRRLWRNYCASEPYAARFSFVEVADNVLSVGEYLSRISLSDN